MKAYEYYNSESELYGIISKYINNKDIKIIIKNGEVTIHYRGKNPKTENELVQPQKVTTIYRAIKKLKSHNLNASNKNVAKYLSMPIGTFRSLVNFYRSKGYRFKIESNKLEYKEHPLYHKMYTVWRGMVQRCYNKNHEMYHRYGGRGIIICDEWRYSPDKFFIDMYDTYIENTKLDRVNNDKGYSKENCRWANQKTQCRNKSKSLKIIYKKEEISFKDLIEELGLKKYEYKIKLNIKKFNDWDSYIDNMGIKFNNKEFCCVQHFIDTTNISSYNIHSLMKRYHRYNKKLPKPILKNTKFYIEHCYNFSENLIKISNNKKVYKKNMSN